MSHPPAGHKLPRHAWCLAVAATENSAIENSLRFCSLGSTKVVVPKFPLLETSGARDFAHRGSLILIAYAAEVTGHP
jgi:hypothetical protein